MRYLILKGILRRKLLRLRAAQRMKALASSRGQRVIVLAALAGSILSLSSAAIAGGSPLARSATPPPTGERPGPDWIQLAPPSWLVNPAFSMIYGTPTSSGCSYQGQMIVNDSVVAHQSLIGIWF